MLSQPKWVPHSFLRPLSHVAAFSQWPLWCRLLQGTGWECLPSYSRFQKDMGPDAKLACPAPLCCDGGPP